MKNLILIFLLLFMSNLSSQKNVTNSRIESTPIKSKTIDESKKNNDNISELDYYKLLYQNSKESNDSYKSLLQWTFGISLAFLIAIIGSQIFFNYRLNKKEIDYIIKDIDEKILELENKLVEKVQNKFDELDESLKISLVQNQKENKETIEAKFKSQEETSKAKFELLEKMTSFEIRDIQNQLDKTALSLKEDIIKNKGDLWKLKGVESNALSSFIEVFFIKKKLNYEIKYILDDIIAILKDLEEIHESDFKKLKDLYEGIKVSHKDKAEKINDLIKNKNIYSFNTATPDFNTGIFGLSRKVIKIKKEDNI